MDHTVTCPGCGRDISIPQGMDACFCTYCGAKVAPSAPPAQAQAAPGGAVPAADFAPEEAAAALTALVAGSRHISKRFNKQHYEEDFRALQRELAPVVRELEARGSGAPDLLADAWLEALAALWQGKGGKSIPRFEDQHLIAIYLIPALRDLPQPSGEALAQALRARWVERWPKTPIGLGDYQSIVSGFRWKLCFITTAVCLLQGKGDDCYELMAFRRFRDEVLLATEEGRALVEEYYRLAPAIVTSIALCHDGEAVYDQVYRRHLLPCLRMIEDRDHAGCQARYVEMVRELERLCLPS